jgi:hypothetical protein
MPLACAHLGPADEGQSSLDALLGIEKQWKSESCIVEVLAQKSAVLSLRRDTFLRYLVRSAMRIRRLRGRVEFVYVLVEED